MTAAQVFPSHNDFAYLRVLVKRLDPDLSGATPTQALPGDAGSTSWPSPVVLAPASGPSSAPASRWPRGTPVSSTPAGTIDSGYRGEIKVIAVNHGSEPIGLRRGERIAQLVFQGSASTPCPAPSAPTAGRAPPADQPS